jgi:hypothetical protein
VDESNKFRINSTYYIAAILLITSTSYFDILRDLREKHKNLDNRKELKFINMDRAEVKNLLYDIKNHKTTISIHIEKGTTERPLELLYNILNNIKSKKQYERILILDSNFLTNKKEEASLRKHKCTVVTKKSHKIPALQIADIIAGSFRLFHEENSKLLNIVLSNICEYSRNNLKHPKR